MERTELAVVTGLANRIVEMAEREQAARPQAIAENDARKKEITGRACKDSEENTFIPT